MDKYERIVFRKLKLNNEEECILRGGHRCTEPLLLEESIEELKP